LLVELLCFLGHGCDLVWGRGEESVWGVVDIEARFCDFLRRTLAGDRVAPLEEDLGYIDLELNSFNIHLDHFGCHGCHRERTNCSVDGCPDVVVEEG
jgi:hypothetical protein